MIYQQNLSSQFLLFTTILLLFGSTHLSGQFSFTDMISPASWDSGDLSGEQVIRYQKIDAPSNSYSSVTKINIGNLSNSLQDGRLKINVGNTKCGEATYKVRRIEYLSESDYVWYGELETADLCDCATGSLLLISKEGEKFGSINIDGDKYDILDLTNGKNIVAELPTSINSEFFCNGPVINNDLGSNEVSADERGSGNCEVRVLILYSSSILSKIPNVETTAILHINYTNQVLANSGINASSLRFKLVATLPSPISEGGNSMGQFLIDHENNQEVKDLRIDNDADLVIIYGDRSAMDMQSSETSYGLAHAGIGLNPAAKEDAFGVVGFFGINPNNWVEETFAHEIAHICGAKHESCNAAETGPGCSTSTNYAHAHVFNSSNPICDDGYKTIMYSWITNNWIPHYSNPDINFDGFATGTSMSNNASVIRDNACIVANHNSATNNLIANINGATEGCVSESINLNAIVQGAPGPYQYEWQVADANGTIYGNVVSTASSYSLELPQTTSGIVNIMLTVTAGDGSDDITWHTIEIITEDCPIFLTSNPSEIINVHSVSPNPTVDASILEFELSSDAKVKILIQNYNGSNEVEVADKVYQKGIHREEVRTSSLKSGLYFIKMETGNKVYAEKLLVIK